MSESAEERALAAEARARAAEARAGAAEAALEDVKELLAWAREKKKEEQEEEDRERRRKEKVLKKKRAEEAKKQAEEVRRRAYSRRHQAYNQLFTNGIFSYMKGSMYRQYSYSYQGDVLDAYTKMVGFVYVVPESAATTAALPLPQESCTGLAALVRPNGASATALSCIAKFLDRPEPEDKNAIVVHYPDLDVLFQAEAVVNRELGVAMLKPIADVATLTQQCFKCTGGATSGISYAFGRKRPVGKDEGSSWSESDSSVFESPVYIEQDKLRHGLGGFHVRHAAKGYSKPHSLLVAWDSNIKTSEVIGSPVVSSYGHCCGIVVAVHRLSGWYDSLPPGTLKDITGRPLKCKEAIESELEIGKRAFLFEALLNSGNILVEAVNFHDIPGFFSCPAAEWEAAHPVSEFIEN